MEAKIESKEVTAEKSVIKEDSPNASSLKVILESDKKVVGQLSVTMPWKSSGHVKYLKTLNLDW